MSKRIAVYTGVFLDTEAVDYLKSWWKTHCGPMMPDHFCHHMTIKFKPDNEELYALPVGEYVDLRVAGWVDDDGVQAVVVEPQLDIKSSNEVPHITVATDGQKPFKSNAVLASGWNRVDDGPLLKGRVGYFARNIVWFDLPNENLWSDHHA